MDDDIIDLDEARRQKEQADLPEGADALEDYQGIGKFSGFLLVDPATGRKARFVSDDEIEFLPEAKILDFPGSPDKK